MSVIYTCDQCGSRCGEDDIRTGDVTVGFGSSTIRLPTSPRDMCAGCRDTILQAIVRSTVMALSRPTEVGTDPWVCSDCGSKDVQLRYPVWIDANGSLDADSWEIDYDARPERDPDLCFCLACDTNVNLTRRSATEDGRCSLRVDGKESACDAEAEHEHPRLLLVCTKKSPIRRIKCARPGGHLGRHLGFQDGRPGEPAIYDEEPVSVVWADGDEGEMVLVVHDL